MVYIPETEEEIKKKEIEELIPINQRTKKVNRSHLNIQSFMDDMELIQQQVRNPDLRKPAFNFGDGSVTNYLLWLILAELMMLNDRRR